MATKSAGGIVLKIMLLAAALCLGLQRTPPDELIRSLVDHYRKLKSLSAKVVHHGDFMSSVKDATDTLNWLGPKRFELTSDKDSVPKLLCDGRELTTVIPQFPGMAEAFDQNAKKIGNWEYRGGFLLSVLMRSPLADQYLHPEKPVKVTYAYGKTLRWHDLPVSDIEATLSRDKTALVVSYFLTPDYKSLVGMEIASGAEQIWTQYTDIQENPTLPKNLGSNKK